MEYIEDIENMDIDKSVETSIQLYGIEINMRRGFPDYRDGLKTLIRRIIYTMYEHDYYKHLMVAKKLEGDVVGDYHPHGDAIVGESAARLTPFHSHFPLIIGEGNWGSSTKWKANSKYPKLKIHPYIKFFTEYMSIMEGMPNYYGKLTEPVYLPCTIPYMLIPGSSGMGVGWSHDIPSHDPINVINSTIAYLSGNRNDKEIINLLGHPVYVYGGRLYSSQEDLYNMYVNGEGTIYFTFTYDIVKKKGKTLLLINGFPRGSGSLSRDQGNKKRSMVFNKILRKIRDLPYASKVIYDEEADNDRSPAKLTIEVTLKKNINAEDIVEDLDKQLKSRISYRWNVVMSNSEIEKCLMFKCNLMDFFNYWTSYRIDLENKWQDHKIKKEHDSLYLCNLRIYLINNLDILKKALESPNTIDILKNELGLNDEQVDYTRALKFRQLERFNIDKEEQKIIECNGKILECEANKADVYNYVISKMYGYIDYIHKHKDSHLKKKR
jgi:DNA gyrase/topoisomerase IV subunit A